MNVVELMEQLKKELESLFSDYRFIEPTQRIQFFIQNPPRSRNAAERETLEPYQVIVPSNGNQDEDDNIANIIILIYVEDKSEDQQGWVDVMNQIDRIRLRFLNNPIFGRRYEVKNLNWALADDNPYPKWLGGVELKISMQRIEMEGALYD